MVKLTRQLTANRGTVRSTGVETARARSAAERQKLLRELSQSGSVKTQSGDHR